MEIDGIEYLDVQQAAKELDVSPGRVRQLITENRVNSIKLGQFRLIRALDIASIKAEARTAGRPPKSKTDEK
jgi:excisionase family DNA binding protein